MQPRLAHPTLGRRLRIQPQMAQDLLDHRPLLDGGDDLEVPGAAVRAALHVDIEHPLEQPCPADACGPDLDGLGLALDAGCGNACSLLILGRPCGTTRLEPPPHLGVPAPVVARPAPAPAPAPVAPVAAAVPAAAVAPITSVDLPLELEEPDEVSQDLAQLFAIRDANLPGTGKN